MTLAARPPVNPVGAGRKRDGLARTVAHARTRRQHRRTKPLFVH